MKRRRRVDEPAHVESIDAAPAASAGDHDRAPGSGVDVADPARGPDDLAMNTWLGQRVRRALAALSPGDRMIVLAASCTAIERHARTCRAPLPAAVRTRARARVRKLLEESER